MLTGRDLHLIDLATWDMQVIELRLPRPAQVAFSPDGRLLAIASGDRQSALTLFDVGRAIITAQGSMDFLVNRMRFTADSSGLMLYGTVIRNRFTENEMSPDPPEIALLESVDLKVRWSARLHGVRHGIMPKDSSNNNSASLHHSGEAIYLYPGLAFVPYRDALYLVHANQDVLTTVDFSAETVTMLEIRDRLTWFERLLTLTAGRAHAKVAEGSIRKAVISPDGRFLYVVGESNSLIQEKNGDWQIIQSPLGLQVIDTANGKRLSRYATSASEVSNSPDGETLYLRAWDGDRRWTEVFEVASGEIIARMQNQSLFPVQRVDRGIVLVSSNWVSGDTHQAVHALIRASVACRFQ